MGHHAVEDLLNDYMWDTDDEEDDEEENGPPLTFVRFGFPGCTAKRNKPCPQAPKPGADRAGDGHKGDAAPEPAEPAGAADEKDESAKGAGVMGFFKSAARRLLSPPSSHDSASRTP